MTKPDHKNLIAINTRPWPRAEMVALPGAGSQSSNTKFGLLRSDGGIARVEDPSSSTRKSGASVKEIRTGVFELANDEYKIQVEKGVIISLFDLRAQREIIPKGAKANQLVIFDDKPLYWQAWDVEVYHLDTREELQSGSTSILAQGPDRVSVLTETKISDKSSIKTAISLAASVDGFSSYVEMDCQVEWHEAMRFLKVEFPVDILNTEASYETQHGIVRRPTHYNTR